VILDVYSNFEENPGDPLKKEEIDMKRILAIIGLVLSILGFGSAAIAEAGPGCPDKPGVCPPDQSSEYDSLLMIFI
jgi:hypothetical protein